MKNGVVTVLRAGVCNKMVKKRKWGVGWGAIQLWACIGSKKGDNKFKWVYKDGGMEEWPFGAKRRGVWWGQEWA
jgi:hypothetical protein